MEKNKRTLYILIFITCVITVISFRSYFKYASLAMDDYVTFDFAPAEASMLQACKATTDSLYSAQGRYQPVRLCVFVALTRLFNEAQSPYYNFALHLANIILLFLLLKKFQAGSIFSLLSVLLFAVFGRFRYMDSSSAMIGGSGLSLFFILITFLFLIKALQTHTGRFLRRYLYLAISVLAYSGLVFSYEVAIPLFAPIVAIFYLFVGGGKGFLVPLKTKKSFYLFLYVVPLSIYLIFFRLFVSISYDGAKIVWSLNILRRLNAYVLYTLIPPFQIHGLTKIEFIILALFFGAIIFILKKTDESSIDVKDKTITSLRLLFFSAVFYPSTVVIFTLNSWGTPTQVMVHHTYLMTAASALLLVSFFYTLQWVLLPDYRKKYKAILIIFIFPIILINAERQTVRHYKNDAARVTGIRTMKGTLKHNISNIEKIDAIILKNFYYPYYNMTSLEGAFTDWFGFKKSILSGREIISVKGGDIIFKGPLHGYIRPEKERRVANNRVMIFFLRLRYLQVVPYNDFIDFDRRLNLYQTVLVKKDCPRGGCIKSNILEAILSNFKGNRYLNIWFASSRDAKNFLDHLTSFEVNDEPVFAGDIDIDGNRLSMDVSLSTKKINYFFLKIISDDDEFKESIGRIDLAGATR